MRRVLLFVVLYVVSVIARGQDIIRGTVVDSLTQEPLSSATVYLNGTTLGTTTDVDGRFELKDVLFPATIIFSFVGYAHRAIDHIKEHERIVFVERLPNEPETEEEPDVGRVPPDVLTRLIGQLPAGCRTVLNLYVFEQLPHKEIARLLGVKPETSAAQYSRAKKTLAKLIKNYQKTHEQ